MKRALGVCYYPEHWPEARWQDDAARMNALGLSWVRIGEFAWSRLEPAPGEYDFGWLDRAIEILGAQDLNVILGTPTATPPRWMLERHPDMLALDAEGRPRGFGSRRHYCFSHPGYRAECARIVEALAERYGGNSAIAAWQTDNEYGCHDTTLSYSTSAKAAFQEWLARKYVQIEGLNQSWGTVFWSMEYRTFDEVDLPNLTVTEAAPGHVLDFRRFSSDQVVSFNRLQAEIIRRHSDAPITHNYMGNVVDFDHFAVGADLEFASWDSYPLGFLEDRIEADPAYKRTYARQGDPDFQAFHHDLYRTVGHGRWWVMEQQPGPVNWAPYNPAPLPGMVRLWAWEAFAHGAEVVSFFRWRQVPFGQEQLHAGLLLPDGTGSAAWNEVSALAQELNDAPEVETAKARVALMFDYESAWAWSHQPQGRDFDYFRLVFDWYRALRQLGQTIDIIPPSASDLSAYRLVLAPGAMALSPHFLSALHAFDGIAIVGPRTNARTHDMQIPVPLPPGIPGLDVRVTWLESLRPDMPVALRSGGNFVGWREWLEGSCEILETAKDGIPAIVRAGGTFYVGGWPDREGMRRLLRLALNEAGLHHKVMPDGVRVRETTVARYIFNYGERAVIFDGQRVKAASLIRQAI